MTEAIRAGFMERHFGAEAHRVTSALVAAGNEAHARSMDAKKGSRLRSNHAYGSTFWLALPEEVVARLLEILDGAVAFPPRGAQYELLVWKGTAILPVKVMEASKRDSRMRVRVSDLRSRLTRVNLPKAPEATLFDETDESAHEAFLEEARKVAAAAQAAIGNVAQNVLVAAYRCSPQSGVRVVRVGIATLDADGHIEFSDSEQLSLLESGAVVGTAVAVAGETFDAAPRPKPALEVVAEEATATGEDMPDIDSPTTEK